MTKKRYFLYLHFFISASKADWKLTSNNTWIDRKFRLWQIRLHAKIWYFSWVFSNVFVLQCSWVSITSSFPFFVLLMPPSSPPIPQVCILSEFWVKSLGLWFPDNFQEKIITFFLLCLFHSSAFCNYCFLICYYFTLFFIHIWAGNILPILKIATLVSIWSICVVQLETRKCLWVKVLYSNLKTNS